MVGITQKNLGSVISIVVSYCPLNNCPRHFFPMTSCNRAIWKHLMTKRFFSRWGYTLNFCWSDLVITENFSNSAAHFLLLGDVQVLLVEAGDCAQSISCFQDDLSLFKGFRLKVFKCPNSESNYFEWQVCLLNYFVLIQKQIK